VSEYERNKSEEREGERGNQLDIVRRMKSKKDKFLTGEEK